MPTPTTTRRRSRRSGTHRTLQVWMVAVAALIVTVGLTLSMVWWYTDDPPATTAVPPLATPTASPDKPDQLAVLFLGDSVTEDDHAGLNGESQSKPWPIRLTVRERSPWLQADNIAVAGETLGKQAKRWASSGVNIPGVDAVVVLAGTNDASKSVPPERTAAALSDLIDAVEASGQSIVVISPPPNDTYNELVAPVVAVEKRVAKAAGVQFIDIFHGLGGPSGRWPAREWTVDGVHPSDLGQDKIADYVLSKVRA